MKRSFVIENRPGATGNIGTAAVANAKPDGCTLLVNAAVIATFPWSFSKLGFDPVKDLTPIGGIGVTPTLLVAPKSLPADDLKGLVLLSKQRPDGLSFSTAGYGLLQHLAVEEMAQRTGAKFVHVVYKGGAQAATDLIAGRVDFGSFAAGSVIQFVKEGQLKPLGVIQEARSDLVPAVATTTEQGLPGPRCRGSFHVVCAGGNAPGGRFAAQRGTEQGGRRSDPEAAVCQYRLRPDRAHPRGRGDDHAQDRRGLGPPHQAPEYQAGLTARNRPADPCVGRFMPI
jgi:tripartite-type tricarboxylate transporter receptor subunit TctC